MTRKTHEFYENELFEREINYLPLEKYVTAHHPILHQCINDHVWKCSPRNILNNKGCPYCAGNKRKTTDSYKSELLGTDYQLLEEYKGSNKTPLLHKHICGFEWKCSPDNILRGTGGCPKCGKAGFDPSKPGYLYFVSFSYILDTYYKIGITNNEIISKRFRGDWLRFNMQIIWVRKYENGLEAQEAETSILRKYKSNLLNTDILKNGNSETFDISNIPIPA